MNIFFDLTFHSDTFNTVKSLYTYLHTFILYAFIIAALWHNYILDKMSRESIYGRINRNNRLHLFQMSLNYVELRFLFHIGNERACTVSISNYPKYLYIKYRHAKRYAYKMQTGPHAHVHENLYSMIFIIYQYLKNVTPYHTLHVVSVRQTTSPWYFRYRTRNNKSTNLLIIFCKVYLYLAEKNKI